MIIDSESMRESTMIKYLKQKLILLFIFVTPTVSCAQSEMSNQNHIIYQMTIETLFKDFNQLVIIDSTLIDTSKVYENYKDGDYEYYDFLVKAKQKSPLSINASLFPNKDIVLLSYDQFVESLTIGSKKMWDNFYDKYPNSPGIIKISPIGYSQDSTKAWLEISNFKGGYSGFDAAIRLKKVNDQWVISGDIHKAYY